MFGLTIIQEAALAMVCLQRDELPANLTNVGLTKQFLVLRDQDMLEMKTDWGGELAFVQKLLPAGANHYDRVRSARRRFVAVSDEADELLDLLYGEAEAQKKAKTDVLPTCHKGRDDDYRELSRNGLIDVTWADNMPYLVALTDRGWSYAEGWFLDQEDSMKININPVFNNNANSLSMANAYAAASNVTLGSTIQQILDLDIDQEIKEQAEEAVKGLDRAARTKDKIEFLDKLEKVAGIAKNSIELAGIVGPYIAAVTSQLFG